MESEVDMTKPMIDNQDGSFSTVRSFSFNEGGKEILIPSIVDGKRLSNNDAIKAWKEGRNEELGRFNTPEEATNYSKEFSKKTGQMRKTEQQEAYASNPRYAPEGLESEIESEELNEARRKDSQQLAQQELQDLSKPDMTDVPMADEETPPKEPEFDLIQTHEKILGVVDTATRVPRDIAGGLQKATDSALNLIVGRDNLDTGNKFLADNFPGLTDALGGYREGIAPEGTVSKVTQDLTQFFGPFAAYMKGIGALNAMTKTPQLGMFTKAFTADVLASGTALDPHMERFSAFAKSAGIENEFIGWLADNSDESDSMGRLKNMIENSGLGVGLQATLGPVLMTMKALYRGSKATISKIKEKPEEFENFELDETAENFGMPEFKSLQDTDELLKETIGNTAPERIQFRKEAVRSFVSDAKPSKNPTVTFMGGGGASGKGSIQGIAKKFMPKDAVTIDPDSIKQVVPEYEKIIKAGDERAAATVHEESSQIAKSASKAIISKKANAVIDVTLGNVESGLKKIKEFKEAGYKVNLVGVTVDAGEAVSRAVSRALQTKRSVPIEQLLKGHKGFSKGFEEYVRLVDEGILYDNSGAKPVAIAIIKKGKLERLDKKAYATFSSKGEINEKAKTLRELRQPIHDAGGSKGSKGQQVDEGGTKAGITEGVRQGESGKAGPGNSLDEINPKKEIVGLTRAHQGTLPVQMAKQWGPKSPKIEGHKVDFIRAKDSGDLHRVKSKEGEELGTFYLDDNADGFWASDKKLGEEKFFSEVEDVMIHFDGEGVPKRAAALSDKELGKIWRGAAKINGEKLDYIRATSSDDVNKVLDKRGNEVASFWYEDGPDAFVVQDTRNKSQTFYKELSDLIEHYEAQK